MGAQVVVWQPPQMESAVGKRIAVPPIVGPNEITEPIREKMLTLAPRDAGRQLVAVAPETLNASESIRLVSGTDDVNDIALASVAEQADIDYVMRGRILTAQTGQQAGESRAFDPNVPLAVSWRLTSASDHRLVGGAPVVVDLKSAIETYPDLALVADPNEALATAAVREAYRLIAPSFTLQDVELAAPYALPGSKAIRRGNALAKSGRWGDAQAIWETTLEKHPTQTAAIHNLAIAAAAGQDFSKAKALIRRAIRRQPTGLSKRSMAWIETMQRQYHKAFDLPDPPEGWFITNEDGS
ncbi:Tetratricopeptide repeat protein [Rubripirellula tenax]|uniref:Tetratricopeptide repeat protein n=2 Tax=Rubripirellula tenax TaxID=2528015 RepID=A0A5C6FHL9_9BACT|nr:Tetratricopeptide repeat protein [Rubripirellula tenax]